MIRNTSILFSMILLTMLSAGDKVLIPDPCKLLTQQEIEKIVQVPMKPGRLRDGRSYFSGMSCEYFSLKQFEKPGSVKITIDTTASMKATDSIYESAKELYSKQKYAYKEALKDHHKEDTFLRVEGLGDDAYWVENSLRILDGNRYIAVSASGGPKLSAHSSQELDKKVQSRNIALSKEVAKLVLERVGQKKQ